MVRTHQLKTWPSAFAAIKSGKKTFEFRIDDRGFQVGDILQLQEYDPLPNEYTGSEVLVEVTYIARDLYRFDVREGYVCMSIVPLKQEQANG